MILVIYFYLWRFELRVPPSCRMRCWSEWVLFWVEGDLRGVGVGRWAGFASRRSYANQWVIGCSGRSRGTPWPSPCRLWRTRWCCSSRDETHRWMYEYYPGCWRFVRSRNTKISTSIAKSWAGYWTTTSTSWSHRWIAATSTNCNRCWSPTSTHLSSHCGLILGSIQYTSTHSVLGETFARHLTIHLHYWGCTIQDSVWCSIRVGHVWWPHEDRVPSLHGDGGTIRSRRSKHRCSVEVDALTSPTSHRYTILTGSWSKIHLTLLQHLRPHLLLFLSCIRWVMIPVSSTESTEISGYQHHPTPAYISEEELASTCST